MANPKGMVRRPPQLHPLANGVLGLAEALDEGAGVRWVVV